MNLWWPPEVGEAAYDAPETLYFQSRYKATVKRVQVGDQAFIYECATPPGRGYDVGAGRVFALVKVLEPLVRGGSAGREVGRRWVNFDVTADVKCLWYVPPEAGVPFDKTCELLGYQGFRFPGGLSAPLDPARARNLERELRRWVLRWRSRARR